MRPVLATSTQKWNDEVSSGSIWPHLQWSSFKRPHRPQGYGLCILRQRMSSDDWLLVAKQECYTGILSWISPQTARCNHWKVSRKVDTLGAASQRQRPSAYLPCCHGRYAWVRLRTSLSTTLFCRFDSIGFSTIQIFKWITPWACFWGRWSRHYGHNFSIYRCDFMMGLGKPKLYTKFEIISFTHCVNIEGKPPDFGELP